MDPDYLEELAIRLRAESDWMTAERKKAERKHKGEDVSLSEIT